MDEEKPFTVLSGSHSSHNHEPGPGHDPMIHTARELAKNQAPGKASRTIWALTGPPHFNGNTTGHPPGQQGSSSSSSGGGGSLGDGSYDPDFLEQYFKETGHDAGCLDVVNDTRGDYEWGMFAEPRDAAAAAAALPGPQPLGPLAVGPGVVAGSSWWGSRGWQRLDRPR